MRSRLTLSLSHLKKSSWSRRLPYTIMQCVSTPTISKCWVSNLHHAFNSERCSVPTGHNLIISLQKELLSSQVGHPTDREDAASRSSSSNDALIWPVLELSCARYNFTLAFPTGDMCHDCSSPYIIKFQWADGFMMCSHPGAVQGSISRSTFLRAMSCYWRSPYITYFQWAYIPSLGSCKKTRHVQASSHLSLVLVGFDEQWTVRWSKSVDELKMMIIL